MKTAHSTPALPHSAYIPLIGTGSAFVALVGLAIAMTSSAAMML